MAGYPGAVGDECLLLAGMRPGSRRPRCSGRRCRRPTAEGSIADGGRGWRPGRARAKAEIPAGEFSGGKRSLRTQRGRVRAGFD